LAANDKTSLNSTALIFESIHEWKLQKTNGIKTMELAALYSAVKHLVNIGIANEIAIFCEKAGINYSEVANLTGSGFCSDQSEPTINAENYRNEAYLLLESAENFNPKMKLPKLAMQINGEMNKHALNLIYDGLRVIDKSLRRAKISIIGGAAEGSSSADLIEVLKSKGAKISRYHPQADTRKYSLEKEKERSLKRTLNEAVEGTDCLIILGDQEQIRRLNLKKLKAIMNKSSAIIDLVDFVDSVKAEKEGFIYRGLGRGEHKR
jgi:UDP-N-acetyl-D-mannosaminuronate dehydrogenase